MLTETNFILHWLNRGQMRTSVSHPLQIAEVSADSGYGRIGLTFCPGKSDRHALTGAWERDLDLDLDLIRNWGAAAVVTASRGEGA